jgi:hypothetical protein
VIKLNINVSVYLFLSTIAFCNFSICLICSIDPIHIDDPLCPANNVGRNCFRIHQCIKAFADAFTVLENELLQFSAECYTPVSSFNLLKKIMPSIDFDEL